MNQLGKTSLKKEPPYKDLFIYYLMGNLTENEENQLGENFIGNWVEDETSFLFFSSPAYESISSLIDKRPDLELLDDYYFTYEQWQGERPSCIRIQRFVISPPWEPFSLKEGEVPIVLDPGVVFGNGLHPTTRDCLKALNQIYSETDPKSVLDLGTGTGILSLAAVKLGAEQVTALDLNPLAAKTAKKNVELNKLENMIKVIHGDAICFKDTPVDLVVANIHHAVTAKLMESKTFRSTEWFILSGLMRTEAGEIKALFRKFGLKLVKEWDHDMTWFTLLAKGSNNTIIP